MTISMSALGKLLTVALTVGEVFAGSPVIGTWQSEKNGLPATTITIRRDGSGFGGTVTFRFHLKDNGVWRVAGEHQCGLSRSEFDGKVFSFQTACPRDKLGLAPWPSSFRMNLTAKDEATLKNLDHPGEAPLTVVRQK